MKVKEYMISVYAVLVKNSKRDIESLPEEYQTIIMEEAANAREIELQENDEDVILQRLIDAGMEVNEVDKEAFVERMSDIWARFDEEYGEEWIDLALAAQE